MPNTVDVGVVSKFVHRFVDCATSAPLVVVFSAWRSDGANVVTDRRTSFEYHRSNDDRCCLWTRTLA